ncbi:class I SAM-dependent methyltransferase [Caloramator sp. ALD01]|uniref:class I SAM-dependent DNA methyltransferase n=1 Tax=Caloramator sp. ALD01 TaxID=1031288 RepID=UPI000415D48A|nr:class I SAM-dependent methyltransferase [Caloramator sp. ALD01]
MEQYSNLSLVYDELMDVDYKKWADFVSTYFKNKNIELKYKKGLELGCGTGNMTIYLKKLGLDLVALDSSEDMLTKAEEKLRRERLRATLLKQDIRSYNLNKKFPFIFSFCDCFNYITNYKDLESSFKNVYNHLEDDGYFLFDISTEYKLRNLIGEKTFTLNREDICYIWDNYINEDILEMYITFFVKEGKYYRRFDERHIQKIYRVEEIIEVLNKIGFKEVEVFDDYKFKDYSQDSIRAVFVIKK